MWERCRPHRVIGFITVKGDKEGQTTGWNKSGLNNKSKSISWLSNTLSLISNLLAPLFRRVRATFSQFNFLCLCFAPPSGKTFICFMLFILIFGKLSPLFRRMRATFSRFNFFDLCFAPPSGKTFSLRSKVSPPRRSISKFWAKLGGMPLPWDVVINWNSIRQRGASVKLK